MSQQRINDIIKGSMVNFEKISLILKGLVDEAKINVADDKKPEKPIAKAYYMLNPFINDVLKLSMSKGASQKLKPYLDDIVNNYYLLMAMGDAFIDGNKDILPTLEIIERIDLIIDDLNAYSHDSDKHLDEFWSDIQEEYKVINQKSTELFNKLKDPKLSSVERILISKVMVNKNNKMISAISKINQGELDGVIVNKSNISVNEAIVNIEKALVLLDRAMDSGDISEINEKREHLLIANVVFSETILKREINEETEKEISESLKRVYASMEKIMLRYKNEFFEV